MITNITYERRFSLGNYEHETITVGVSIDDDSGTPEEELLQVRELVAEHCTARLRQKALKAIEGRNGQAVKV